MPKDASQEDIKKTFRKLARIYHPDQSKADDKAAAEEKFKEIAEAYDVLGDPEKRKKYDTLGSNWNQDFGPQGHGSSPDGGFSRGFTSQGGEYHFSGTGFSDFFEQYFGGGHSDFGGFRDGGAATRDFSMRGRDIEGEIMITLQEASKGATRQVSVSKTDSETGREAVQTYNVKIPAGIREGQRIRVARQGHAGQGSGESGDLFLKARFAADPDFRISGGDLYHDLEVAPWDAALGNKLEVPTLDGKVRLNIPEGTPSGKRFRIPGKGLPSINRTAGDLIVEIHIKAPEVANETQRKAWEALKRSYK